MIFARALKVQSSIVVLQVNIIHHIHLNPLRARIVKELKELDNYRYGGHSVMMGKNKKEWQDADCILAFYDRKHLTARRRYREYKEQAHRLVDNLHDAGRAIDVKEVRKRFDLPA